MAIDYGSYRRRARKIGKEQGIYRSLNQGHQAVVKRLQQMSDDTVKRNLEWAKSEYANAQKASRLESVEVDSMIQAGKLARGEDGKLNYTDSYWASEAEKDFMGKFSDRASRNKWQANEGGFRDDAIKHFQQGKAKNYVRRTKTMEELNAIHAANQGSATAQGQSITDMSPSELAASILVGRVPKRVMGSNPMSYSNSEVQSPDTIDNGNTSAPVGAVDAPDAKDGFDEKYIGNAVIDGELVGGVMMRTYEDGRPSLFYKEGEDGQMVKLNNVQTRATTEEGERNRAPKLSKVQQDNLQQFDRNDRVQRLAVNLAKKEYMGNPADFIRDNLSTLGDAVGATFGITGNHEQDLANIAEFVQGKINQEGLSDAIGSFDASAVVRGDVDAMTKFLVYATADLYNQGGKISVASIESARDTIETFIAGSVKQDGALMSLANQAQSEMARITGNHLRELKGQDDNPLWASYPAIQREAVKGTQYVASLSEGISLGQRINKMPEAAKNKTLMNLRKFVGTADIKELEQPIRFVQGYDTPVVIMHRQGKDGSISFRLVPIK